MPQVRALEQLRRLSNQRVDDGDKPCQRGAAAAAFEPTEQDTYGYSVDGINDGGRGLLEELEQVELVDWDGTKVDETG